MWLMLLEALAALVLLVFIVWWIDVLRPPQGRARRRRRTRLTLHVIPARVGHRKLRQPWRSRRDSAAPMRLRSAGAHAARAQRQLEGQPEAHADVQQRRSRRCRPRTTRTARACSTSPAQRAERRGQLPGGQRDVAHLQRQAEEGQHRRHQAEHHAQRDVGRHAARCWRATSSTSAARAPRPARATMRGFQAMALSRRWKTNQFSDPAGDQRAGEQQHAGEGGVQRRRPEQRQRVQHVLGLVLRRPAARRTAAAPATAPPAPAARTAPGCRRCRPPASGSGAPRRRRRLRPASSLRQRRPGARAIAGAVIAGCLVATVQCSSMISTKLARVVDAGPEAAPERRQAERQRRRT